MSFLYALASQAQSATPPIIYTPPPIVRIAPPAPPAPPAPAPPRIASFHAGQASCSGAPQLPRAVEQPLPSGIGYLPPALSPEPIRLQFRIDAEGHPLSIRSANSPSRSGIDGRDVAAALAAWRFAPGAERGDCTVAFDVRVAPVEAAELPVLHRYLALSRPGLPGFNQAVGRAAFQRVKPAGSDCFDPPPAVRQRVYPAFEEIAQAPGGTSYTFLHFDVDAEGRPVNVRVASSSGNDELDRQSLDAVGRSRFAPERHRGCTYTYFRRPDVDLAAPEPLPMPSYRPKDSTCTPDEERWAHLPPLSFPPEFQHRRILGWAIIRYDLAPWGQVGNASVVAAEPAAAFGDQALQTVRNARARESAAGAVGCIVRVRYRMPERGESAPE